MREHALASGAPLTFWIRDRAEADAWAATATTSYLVVLLSVACHPKSYVTHDPREWELTRPHREAVIAEIDRRIP